MVGTLRGVYFSEIVVTRDGGHGDGLRDFPIEESELMKLRIPCKADMHLCVILTTQFGDSLASALPQLHWNGQKFGIFGLIVHTSNGYMILFDQLCSTSILHTAYHPSCNVTVTEDIHHEVYSMTIREPMLHCGTL